MGVWSSIKSGIKKHFDKKKEEQEMMDRLRLEARMQQQQIFEEEFKKNALEVAQANARKQAANLSGLQKLRALNRSRRLTESGSNPGSFFSRMAEYTQKNLAKREENLKRTAELRDAAKKMREEELAKRQQERANRITHKPFGSPSWKM